MSKIGKIIKEIESIEDFPQVRRIRLAVQKHEKSLKSTKPISNVVQYSSESYRLAEKLSDLCHKNFPIIKEPKLEDWAIEIDKVHRIDKQSYEVIESVLIWSQQDSFWKQNIRSASALRRNFEKMFIKAMLDFKNKQKGRIHNV